MKTQSLNHLVIATALACAASVSFAAPGSHMFKPWKKPTHNPFRHEIVFSEEVESIGNTQVALTFGFPTPPPRSGVGSLLMSNNALWESNPTELDPANNTRVGSSRTICTRISAVALVDNPTNPFTDLERVSRCDIVAELEDGQVVMSGAFYEHEYEAGVPQTLAITGGTGIYQTARGQAELTMVVFPGGVTKFKLTVRGVLHPPRY